MEQEANLLIRQRHSLTNFHFPLFFSPHVNRICDTTTIGLPKFRKDKLLLLKAREHTPVNLPCSF